ncbi:hypothetical protein HU200_066127 [Digitaria exilis]|uniref:Reverse transcriptase zinc-binding domain-containing protein n=1 Tax=Digitaria exilis TaxID=1010633 RepID=A0A835DT53_9POAL|nr:hypothetical protein HU200_066127 [Digitaria exilis]
MFWRNLRARDESSCELCTGVLETSEHIFSASPRALAVWQTVGIAISTYEHRSPWFLGMELPLPSSVRLDILLLMLWHIWKARNTHIFDKKLMTATDILRRVTYDLDAWSSRYRRHKMDLKRWRDFIHSRCNP